ALGARRRRRLRSRQRPPPRPCRRQPRPRRHGGAHRHRRRLDRAALAARTGNGFAGNIPAEPGSGARGGAGPMIIRVVLADDHALVRAGIRSLLGNMAEVEVVGEASSGEEAMLLAENERPDVILMDIAMKGISGLEAAAHLRESHPGVRVVILSMHS